MISILKALEQIKSAPLDAAIGTVTDVVGLVVEVGGLRAGVG